MPPNPAPLNFKVAVTIGGQREILTLSCARIDDTQGTAKQPTREVREEIQGQLRKFLQAFAPPKMPIGFL